MWRGEERRTYELPGWTSRHTIHSRPAASRLEPAMELFVEVICLFEVGGALMEN